MNNKFVNVPDEDLIRPFLEGNTEVVHELVRRYRKKISGFG